MWAGLFGSCLRLPRFDGVLDMKMKIENEMQMKLKIEN